MLESVGAQDSRPSHEARVPFSEKVARGFDKVELGADYVGKYNILVAPGIAVGAIRTVVGIVVGIISTIARAVLIRARPEIKERARRVQFWAGRRLNIGLLELIPGVKWFAMDALGYELTSKPDGRSRLSQKARAQYARLDARIRASARAAVIGSPLPSSPVPLPRPSPPPPSPRVPPCAALERSPYPVPSHPSRLHRSPRSGTPSAELEGSVASRPQSALAARVEADRAEGDGGREAALLATLQRAGLGPRPVQRGAHSGSAERNRYVAAPHPQRRTQSAGGNLEDDYPVPVARLPGARGSDAASISSSVMRAAQAAELPPCSEDEVSVADSGEARRSPSPVVSERASVEGGGAEGGRLVHTQRLRPRGSGRREHGKRRRGKHHPNPTPGTVVRVAEPMRAGDGAEGAP